MRSPSLDLDKVLLNLFLGHVGNFGSALGHFTREERSILLVKVDQLLADLPSFVIVRLEQVRVGETSKDHVELEGKVVRVDQGGVHALSSLGRMRVACITRHENPVVNIVSADQTLTDGVGAPPFGLDEFELVRVEDSLVGVHDVLSGNLPSGFLGVHGGFLAVDDVNLGVESDHRLVVDVVFTRKDVGASLVGTMDGGNLSNIGEVGLDDEITGAPECAEQVTSHGDAVVLFTKDSDGTSTSVTSDEVLGLHGSDFSIMCSILVDHALDELDGNGVG